MTESDSQVLRCSFCNKAQRDVRKLIAGPTVYICDECVDVCNDVLEESGIPAGRGAKAALRSVRVAEENLIMASDLSKAGNYLGAAREIRNAALAVLRGFALLEGYAASGWSETKVVVTAMEDPEVARLLQVEDTSHVLLRVSVDGAVFTSLDIESATEVSKKLLVKLQSKAESQLSAPRKRPGA